MSLFRKVIDAGATSSGVESVCEACGKRGIMFTYKDLTGCSKCIAEHIDAVGLWETSRKAVSEKVHALTDAVKGRSRHIGKLIVWSIPDMEILRDELEDLMEQTIGLEHFPQTPTQRRKDFHKAEELRKIVLAYIQEHHGLSIQKGSGVYYLKNPECALAVQYFIQDLHLDSFARIFSVYDDPETRNTLHYLAKATIQSELNELSDELDFELLENVSELVLSRRLEMLGFLQGKVRVYRNFLNVDADILLQNIDLIREKLRNALDLKFSAYPQASKFPYGSKVRYTGKKADVYGETGTVVGYAKYRSGNEYIKVKLDKTGTVQPLGAKTLEN